MKLRLALLRLLQRTYRLRCQVAADLKEHIFLFHACVSILKDCLVQCLQQSPYQDKLLHLAGV